MNTHINKSINIFQILFAAFILSAATTSCSSGKSDEELKLFAKEKKDLSESINNSMQDIDSAIKEVEDKLDISEGPIETSLENTLAELQDQKAKLENDLKMVEGSLEKEWKYIKNTAQSNLSNTTQDISRLKSDMADKLEQLTEK